MKHILRNLSVLKIPRFFLFFFQYHEKDQDQNQKKLETKRTTAKLLRFCIDLKYLCHIQPIQTCFSKIQGNFIENFNSKKKTNFCFVLIIKNIHSA